MKHHQTTFFCDENSRVSTEIVLSDSPWPIAFHVNTQDQDHEITIFFRSKQQFDDFVASLTDECTSEMWEAES